MQDKGFKDIADGDTGRVVAPNKFLNGFGAGNGSELDDPKAKTPAVLFPEIQTSIPNDSWGIVRGIADAKGFPILLMNRYSKGAIYELTIPENMADLYNLPQPLLTRLKVYLQRDFPVRLDAPALVSLFAYDNGTFVVESLSRGAIRRERIRRGRGQEAARS